MAKKVPTNNGFQRLTNEPLDPSSIAKTLNEAEHYARNSVLSYEGQIIHVNDARLEEDVNNNINIYEKDYYIDNNKNIVPICELSYKDIGMLIDALYKLNERTITNEIFNNLRDELTDSYEKPEVPPKDTGGDSGEKPAYYSKPWDKSLYNDHQIVVRTSQPSVYISVSSAYQHNDAQTPRELDTDYRDVFSTETISVMHNGKMEYYNVYTFNELPRYVSFHGGGKLLEELVHMCDTSEMEEMGWMFARCSALKSLDLSDWNVSNVYEMYGMFEDCTSLEYVNLDGWDTSKVTNMQNMFCGCESLKDINVTHFDMSKVQWASGMFEKCKSLTEVNMPNWNLHSAMIHSLFRDCTRLVSVNLSGWNTSKVSEMAYMFAGCTLLKTIDLSSFSSADGIEVYMSYLFEDCSSLTSVKLGPLNPMEGMEWQGIFNNTYSLEFSGIDLSLCSESARTKLTEAYTNRYMS